MVSNLAALEILKSQSVVTRPRFFETQAYHWIGRSHRVDLWIHVFCMTWCWPAMRLVVRLRLPGVLLTEKYIYVKKDIVATWQGVTPMKCVSLFTGCAGLEIGLRGSSLHVSQFCPTLRCCRHCFSECCERGGRVRLAFWLTGSAALSNSCLGSMSTQQKKWIHFKLCALWVSTRSGQDILSFQPCFSCFSNSSVCMIWIHHRLHVNIAYIRVERGARVFCKWHSSLLGP